MIRLPHRSFRLKPEATGFGDRAIKSCVHRSSDHRWLLAPVGKGALSIRRVDWSRQFVPDLHIVAIWILEEDVWLARNELAVLAHFAARCANGCQSSLDVCSAFQPEAEVSHAAGLTSVPRLALKDEHVAAAPRLRPGAV